MHQLKSIYNSPFKDLHPRAIHTSFPIIFSNGFINFYVDRPLFIISHTFQVHHYYTLEIAFTVQGQYNEMPLLPRRLVLHRCRVILREITNYFIDWTRNGEYEICTIPISHNLFIWDEIIHKLTTNGAKMTGKWLDHVTALVCCASQEYWQEIASWVFVWVNTLCR